MLPGFIVINLYDIIDIVLIAFLLYWLFKMLEGTTAINLLIGIIAVVLLRIVVSELNMKMLSSLFDAVFSVGFIALIVLFQPEIRKFLNTMGKSLHNNRFFKLIFKKNAKNEDKGIYVPIANTVFQFAEDRTGAIILLTRQNNLGEILKSGEYVDAEISERLLGNLFFKNSPLHDGAVIITGDRIVAAGCILPVSDNMKLHVEYGLRHRAAIGVTEQTDAVAIVVSEQRGTVSIAFDGQVINDVTREFFDRKINEFFPDSIK